MEQMKRMKKLLDTPTTQKGSPNCCCNCKSKLDPVQLFDENIEDIANSLAQVMMVCGIATEKAYQVKPIIRRAFVYHEKMRTRCPPMPGRDVRLNRDDLLQALHLKCDLQRIEAILVYAIIKRAFKAFFHGKAPTTISNPILDAMAIHTQQAAWMHAAFKTVRIFDNYKATFFWSHKFYERQINMIYRDLYKRMLSRSDPLMVPGCSCRGCSKHVVPGQPKVGEPPREKFHLGDCSALPDECIVCGLQAPKGTLKPPRPILNHELKLPRCQKCNSPFLICECNIDQLTGEQFGECGQDSYKVKWFRVEDKPVALPSNVCDTSEASLTEEPSDWTNHHCPIDCQRGSSESSDVCHEQKKAGESQTSDDVETCSDEEQEDIVAKLEDYLNKLWAEEVAATNNPKTYKISQPCPACQRD